MPTTAVKPAAPPAVAASHPLDPLSAAEVAAVAAACRALAAERAWPGALRFNTIALAEPTKAALLAYGPDGEGPRPPRRALAILQTPPSYDAYEAVFDVLPASAKAGNGDGANGPPLLAASLVSCAKLAEGEQPLASPDDCLDAEAIGKADPEVRRLLAARGVADVDLVCCDPWSVHDAPCEGRLIQLFMYNRSSPNDNAYAHPIDIVPLVDLNLKKVVRIDNQHATPPVIPKEDHNYHAELFPGPFRADLKPLDVLQPEGPSFTVEGNLVKWQKWSFRVGFNYREGLVLHQLGYEDGGRVRPVLHRISLVEMAVPYGDVREPFHRKCAMDIGDYGLGNCTLPLTLGCDCLGHIHYFDGVLNNAKGEPVTIKNAVCMHEEDYGLLWKHVDYRSGHSESRRSRRLVISFVATVVNYEYGIYFYLLQDGTITLEIKLTGELSTNLLSEGEGPMPACGTLVGDGVNAQHHQHLFCARVDPAVDDPDGGKGLVVSEVEAVRLPFDPKVNPHGNGFVARETELTSVKQAQRDSNPAFGRIWKIKNPAVINPVTKTPVAFKLVPHGGMPALLAHEDSAIGRRAVFARHALWVTPFDEAQRFPEGEYVLQSKRCTGLARWTEADAPLAGADPVLWVSFGVTHIVRLEDFPVMPCEYTGFTLKPFNFFARGNPGVDVPPGKNAASKQAAGSNGTAGGGCCGNGNGAAAATNGAATNGAATNGAAA